MKLSKLLSLKQRLIEIDLESHRDKDLELITTFKDLLDDSPPVDPAMIQAVESNAQSKKSAIDILNGYLTNYIDRSIKEHYPAYYAQSDSWAQHIDTYDYTQWSEYCDSIYTKTADELIEFSSGRISNMGSWQFPAMVFHVDNVRYLSELFGFYPIYIMDKWREIVPNLEEQYHQAQLRKVRVYDLDHTKDFPMKCMGVVMSRNHFTHCARDQFISELTWLKQTLLPGGRLAFNFNDCEYAKCAELFEGSTRSFMLGTDVREILAKLDLNIMAWEYLKDAGTVWVEAQLTGSFTSKKRAEALGVIQSK